MPNEIHKFLVDNGLSQLSEAEFTEKYSDPNSAKEIHSFMKENALTDLEFDGFYDKYMKGNRMSPSDVKIFIEKTPGASLAGIDINDAVERFSYKTKEEAMSELGKPSPTPQSGSGLGSTQSGGQMPMAQQPRSGASPSSAQNVDFGFKKVVEEIENPAEMQQPVVAEEEVVEEPSFGETAYTSLLTGSARLGESIANTPAFIYDIAAMPQNYIADKFDIPSLKVSSEGTGDLLGIEENKVADFYRNQVELGQKKIQEKYDKGITDYFSNGEYQKGFGLLANQIVESAPVTISLMMGNAAGVGTAGSITGSGLVFGADKKAQLDREAPWMTEEQKINAALMYGLSEGVFEQFGLTKIGGIVKDVFAKSGKEAAEKIAQEGFKTTYGKILRQYFGTMTEEALSEAATQFTQNAIAKYSGEKPDQDLFEGVPDAFIVGMGASSVYGAAPAIVQTAKTKSGQNKQKEIIQKKDQITQSIELPDVPPAAKGALAQELKKLNEEEAELLISETKTFDQLDEAQKQEVNTLEEKANEISQSLQNPEITPDAKAVLEKSLEAIDAQKETILSSAKITSTTDQISFLNEQGAEPSDVKVKKIKSIAEIVEEQKGKKDAQERLDAARLAFKDQQSKGEAIRIRTQEEAKADLIEQRKRRDQEVIEISKIRPDLTDDDILLADIPSVIERTVDRMDLGIPSDPIQIQEAISSLDKKFDELNAYKSNPKRTHTSEQIDEVIDLLSNTKTELQLYQEQISDYDKGEIKQPTRRIEPSVEQNIVKPKETKGTKRQPTETAQPKVTVEEIKSLPLTRIEGAGMGSNQAVGTFISTEPKNRYAKQFPDAEVQSMEVEIENPYVSEDTNMIDFRNELINRRKSELDETDFTEVEVPDGNFTIDDLSDSGIEKVAGMVTEELKAQGYDSIYFPKTETQEGELVVFDREKVKRKDTPQTPQQAPTQANPLADVESTAKALEGKDISTKINTTLKEINHFSDNKTFEFDKNRGAWFTTDKSGYVRRPGAKTKITRYIDESVLNLATEKQVFQAGDGDFEKGLKELENQGYDGVKTKNNNSTEYYIFDVNKTKNRQELISEAYHADKSAGKETELTKAVEKLLTPQQDATQSGKIQQSNIGERPRAAEQQQGEQANRNNQEANVAPSQAETGGGNSATEGGKKKEVAIEDIDDDAVDKTNQTIIAYHATPTGKVSTGKEAGIHIGTKKAAEQVKAGRNQGKGTVEKVKTTIKRPLVLSDMPSWSSANLLSQLYNPATGQYFGLTRDKVREVRDSDMTEKQKQQWILDFLKEKGYDAIAYKNDSEDAGSYSYVLFEEPTIESGGTVSEGTGQIQASTQQEVTPEQQQRINTRSLLSEISDWNKLGSKAKRSPEGVTEMQRLKKAGKELGLTVDTKAIKSGLRLVATNADGQVMTVEKVNKVMNPKRVVWSDANYAVQETTDANGNRVVEFYDAKTGDQIRSNSKEGAKAKEAYYEGNIQKFLGKDKPVDTDALAEYFDNDIDGFNKAVLEYVAESDNAFQIAANYQNFVNHDAELTENAFDPDYELANLVGQISEADFKKHFDRNWLNKKSKWVSEDARRLPLDTRIQEWTSEGVNADTPYLQSLVGAEESDMLNAISDLIQAYPDGPQSVKPTKEGGLLPLASQRFRQLTGKPLNPVTAYEFNEMFNRYAENQAFGFASKVAWEDLTPQQKQEIIDEQTRPVEDEFFFEGTDFENQPELFAENEQDQGGAEEFPTEEQRDEIEEDGFAMPTDEEMAAKRDEIQTDLQKAIQDVKDKFGDLFNQNLGISYDPKVEARKLYNFHVALVNLAKTAIRSGITTAADFAKTLGKRLDKFTERAFNDAMNDLNGDPMIINSEQDMLNAEYQRVAESYAKQREDAKKLKKPFLKRFIEGINAGWFDANYVSKKLLGDVGGYEAIKAKNLLGGASAKAKMQYDTFKREIFGGLNSAEKKLLNDIIQARTIISIDNRYDAKGKQRIKHPGDTNKESQAIFLGQIEESQPELFKKLNDRAEKYFNAQRELLDERLKEGRISIEQYQGMIDNDYSPRVFLEYLIDDAESGSGLTSGGQGSVGRSDIKSLFDGDVNSLFHNAEWLLASNVLATSRSIFHNRANRSLYELAKSNPNNGFIEIQNPNGFNKETGQPTYKDPRSDQRQIQFFENGVRKSMLVTREFGESWNNNNPLLSPQYANAIRIGFGGAIKRLFATGINPLFALSNLPRDIAHSLFFTNAYSPTFPVALAQISTDLVRTAKDAWKFNRSKDKDGRYYKYTMQGGGMDFLATQGLPFEQQALIQSTAKDAMDATVKVFGYINNSSEIWVRLAIREREANKLTAKFARDNGRMPNAAEKESIETSATEVARSQMDFSQGGRWAKAMDNLIPYLNASLQGLRVSARYARENPKVFSYKVAQALAVSAAIAAYNMRFKDDYDDLEDEEKNRNIIIMLDFYKTVDGKKRRAYIRIPKNQSSQWIFAMGEIMGESMAAKEFRPRKGASTLQTLMPPYDPRNIPVIDALNTYETGYDRFREKYVYDKDYRGEPWAEYYENKTPWLWRDIGEQFNISPVRLKAAVGKLTADPDNNMIWVAVTEGYDKLIKSVPEDEQKSINDMAVESMEQMLTPVQRKFLAFTNPDSKSKSIRELEASQATKIKLQNDTVKNYVKKYINDEMTETEARSAFNEWLNTQPKDSVSTKRLKTRFENSIQFKDVDNVFYRMSETKYPEVKARLLFDAYLNAPDDDAREVLLFQAKNNPNVPKDKSSSFWKEFNRLKALGEE